MKTVQQKWFVTVAMAFLLFLTGLFMSGTAFAQQCVDNGDGTITDNGTGLMWQKATVIPIHWDAAMSYTSSLSLGGHSGWRLPNKDELLGLYNSSCKSMMDVRGHWYWSSTTYASNTYVKWRVSLYYGSVQSVNKSYNSYVRAVRAGQ